jgi:hypothetical protein
MVNRAVQLTTVATVVVTLAVSVLALVPAVALADSAVPFRAVVSETFTAGPCGNALVCIVANGHGHATHLGDVSESALVVVDVNPADAVNGCAPETRTTTISAANGDQLTMTGTGLTRCPGSDEANDSFTITGGTGRFAGASGSGGEHNVHTFTGPGVGVSTVWYAGSVSSVGLLDR